MNQFRRLSRERLHIPVTACELQSAPQVCHFGSPVVTNVYVRRPDFPASRPPLAELTVLRTGLTSDTSPQPGLLKSNHGSYLGTPSNYSDLLLFTDLAVATHSYIGTY